MKMTRRLLSYFALAICACFGPSVFAMDRPFTYLATGIERMSDLHATSAARLELTLAQWRTGSEGTDKALSSNLRASSNHFVMSSVKPLPDDGIQV